MLKLPQRMLLPHSAWLPDVKLGCTGRGGYGCDMRLKTILFFLTLRRLFQENVFTLLLGSD